MRNTYFQFKQFRVDQDITGMKVCTDSCIFGAWIWEQDARTFLDIGTGTGLLTLMLAQRHQGILDAVEIDQQAYQQAKTNFKNSPWNQKINLYHADIINFAPSSIKKYDVIGCNPPFFINHLKSPDQNRNQALHEGSLPLSDLANVVQSLLSDSGRFYIMLPPEPFSFFSKLAERVNLFPQKVLTIKENSMKPPLRVMAQYKFDFESLSNSSSEELIIRNPDGQYSDSFKSLLKEFYLYLD